VKVKQIKKPLKFCCPEILKDVQNWQKIIKNPKKGISKQETSAITGKKNALANLQ